MLMQIEFPANVAKRLEERARSEGKEPSAVVVEIVEKELPPTPPDKPLTERERVRAIFKEAGLLSEVDPEMVKQYVKPRSEEEVEEMRQRLRQLSFSPTFSEMIIDDRGPR